MAILKHTSSKNATYGDALDYLKYKHQEDSKTGLYEPILDEYGLLQERENYAICALDGHGKEMDPETWAGACMETNLRFGKNNTKAERKQHIYIISHPEADVPLLTKEALLEEGKAFVCENLPGYEALIAVHMDTDNPHIHVAINSVRSVAREERPWMIHDEGGQVLRCEVCAGGKHQDNPTFRHHCQDWLLAYTRSHGLAQEDNNRVEEQRKQKRKENRYNVLKHQILFAAMDSYTIEHLKDTLKRKYDIDLIHRGSTYSVRLPGAKRNIRLDTVGLPKDLLYSAIGKNRRGEAELRQQEVRYYEKKKYIQWIRERRLKNNAKAEDAIADAAALIAGKIGPGYEKEHFRELHDLIKQVTYLERDLQTEKEKLDRLLERWDGYENPDLSDQERFRHGSYLRWCGCDPDAPEERSELQWERDVVDLQIQEASSLREALAESADQWKDQAREARFRYQREWNLTREEQLRNQLGHIRENRKKLSRIAYNCQKAADRRIYNKDYLAKAEHFRSLWYQKLSEEKEMKARIRELKQARKEQERLHRARERER